MEAVMSPSRVDLRKIWRFEFIGEAGIDAGSLTRIARKTKIAITMAATGLDIE
jgi:hypothetical protein